MRIAVTVALLLSLPAAAQTNLVGTGVRVIPQASAPAAMNPGVCGTGVQCVGWWAPNAGANQYLPTWRTSAGADLAGWLPSQTGNSGLFLTTNGTSASWAASTGAGAGSYIFTNITVSAAGQITAASSGASALAANQLVYASGTSTAVSSSSFVVDNTNKAMAINGVVGSYGLQIYQVTGRGSLAARLATTSDFNALDFLDSSGTQRGAFGYAGSAAAGSLQDNVYAQHNGKGFVIFNNGSTTVEVNIPSAGTMTLRSTQALATGSAFILDTVNRYDTALTNPYLELRTNSQRGLVFYTAGNIGYMQSFNNATSAAQAFIQLSSVSVGFGNTSGAVATTTNLTTTLGASGTAWTELYTRHIVGTQAAKPTIAAGAGAGTGPTLAVTNNSDDIAGQVTLTAGTTPTASATVWTLTFNTAYGTAPWCAITPSNAATTGLTALVWYFDQANSTTTTIRVDAGATGLTGTTVYSWNYNCSQ